MERMRRALTSAAAALSVPDGSSPQGSKKDQSPRTEDQLLVRRTEHTHYTDQLRKIHSSINDLKDALNRLAVASQTLAEDLAPFAIEADRTGLSIPASEILNVSRTLSEECVGSAVHAIDASMSRPLATLLAAHNEVDARLSSRDTALKEHSAAVAELKQLSERQRHGQGALASVRSRLTGTSSRPAALDQADESTTKAQVEQARVVQRVAAAEALASALTAGLEEELTRLLDRRQAVAHSLLTDSIEVLRTTLQCSAASFGPCCDRCGAAAASISSSSVSTSPSGTLAAEGADAEASASACPCRSSSIGVAKLRAMSASAPGRTTWCAVGQSRREALRQETATRKALHRQLRVTHAIGRAVPLQSYMTVAPSTAALEAQEQQLERPGGATPVALVLASPHFLGLLAERLPAAQLCALVAIDRRGRDAVLSCPQPLWWPLLCRWSALPFSDRPSCEWHTHLWAAALGTGQEMGAYWSVAAGQAITELDPGQFEALLALARAEAASGGKDSTAPGGDGDESASARWLTLIEQDVARSYAHGMAFGTSILVKRARTKRLRMIIEGDGTGGVVASVIAGGDGTVAGPVTPARPRRASLPTSVTSVVLTPDWLPARSGAASMASQGSVGSLAGGASGASGASEDSLSMSLNSFLGGTVSLTQLGQAAANGLAASIGHMAAGGVTSPGINAGREGVDGTGSNGRGRPRRGSAVAEVGFSGALFTPVAAGDGNAHGQDDTGAGQTEPGTDVTSTTDVQGQQAELSSVLLAVAASEPGIRYMQGMNAVGRMVLQVLAGAGVQVQDRPRMATRIFLGLLRSGAPIRPGLATTDSPHARLGSLYHHETACLRLRLYQLERLLLRRLPQVHARLAEYGIAVDAFAPSWLLPLYANFTVLDPQAVLWVWAAYLVHGWSALLSVALVTLQMLEPVLVHSSMEECLAALSTPRVHFPAVVVAGDISGIGNDVGMPLADTPSARETAAIRRLVRAAIGRTLAVEPQELTELERDFQFVPKLVG